MITAEIVREFLHYDPTSGILQWEPRARKWFRDQGMFFAWNKRFPGKRAGYVRITKGKPYRYVSVLGKQYPEHGLVWVLINKTFPDGEIDHINGDGTDNRLSNLREVTHRENAQNQRLSSNNTSGSTGVSWHKNRKRWYAYIKLDGKQLFLGYFHEMASAISARKQAEIEHGFHQNHGAVRPL